MPRVMTNCYSIDTTAFSFEMTDSLLPWDEWQFTPFWRMTVCLQCLAFYPVWPCSWPLCDWWVNEACHSSGATTTSAVLQLGHIKGLFLGCGAALTARVVVRCSVCVCRCAWEGCFWLWWDVPTSIILSFLHASELQSRTWHYFNLRMFFVTVPSSMGRSTARYEGCRYFFIFPQQQATTAITKLSA